MAQYLGWFDDSKRPLETKIAEALEAYATRFGRRATVLVVNPTRGDIKIDGVVVVTQPYIRENTMWVGEASPS